MIIQAYAKINLYLAVLSKRDDGYHDLLSLMHNVSLYDTVEIEEADETSFETDAEIPWDDSNTVYRAVRIFEELTGKKTGIRIRLEKGIPAKSGLGGASADAAAVLWYLCETEKVGGMKEMASSVGSDVPFFIDGGCALVEGRGERTESLEPLDLSLEIFSPGAGFSTPKMYRLVDEMGRFGTCGSPEELYDALRSGDAQRARKNSYNAFEGVAERIDGDVVAEARKRLEKHDLVMMTGSGSSFFGLDLEKKINEDTFLAECPRNIITSRT